jgi:hypothetical protein
VEFLLDKMVELDKLNQVPVLAQMLELVVPKMDPVLLVHLEVDKLVEPAVTVVQVLAVAVAVVIVAAVVVVVTPMVVAPTQVVAVVDLLSTTFLTFLQHQARQLATQEMDQSLSVTHRPRFLPLLLRSQVQQIQALQLLIH